MTSSTQTDLDQWNLLLNNALVDPDRAALLSVMADSINVAVVERPDVRIDVASALSAILDAQPYDDQTWREVETSLTICLGEWASRLIGWLVVNSDYALRLGEIRPNLRPEALALIQGLLARYGSDLERAFYMSGGLVDDWQTLQRELWTDPSMNRYRLRFRIMKYNREDVLVESGPDAMLALATQLLGVLNLVPAASAFSQDREPFLSEARRLIETLTLTPAEPPEQATPVSSDSIANASGDSKSG